MLMVELKLKVSEAPDMRVVLPNRAENVAIVRQALTGLADAMRLDDGVLSDIKTAVSEACNNVVLHAYDGREGPLEVYICPAQDELDVVVRDRGLGIQPNPPEPDQGVQGVGLSLIQALTDHVEFRGASEEGTEVGALDLRVGPLEPGGGERLVNASALGGMPAVLAQLADDVDIATTDAGEELRLRLIDER